MHNVERGSNFCFLLRLTCVYCRFKIVRILIRVAGSCIIYSMSYFFSTSRNRIYLPYYEGWWRMKTVIWVNGISAPTPIFFFELVTEFKMQRSKSPKGAILFHLWRKDICCYWWNPCCGSRVNPRKKLQWAQCLWDLDRPAQLPSISGACSHYVYPRLLAALLETLPQGLLLRLISLGQLPASFKLKCTCLVPHPSRPLVWTVR